MVLNPTGSTINYRYLRGFHAFPCTRASLLNQQMCIWSESGGSTELTHTGGLSFAIRAVCLGTVFVAWNERAGQQAAGFLPQSEVSEFNPRLVHNNTKNTFVRYMRFPGPGHQTLTNISTQQIDIVLDCISCMSIWRKETILLWYTSS